MNMFNRRIDLTKVNIKGQVIERTSFYHVDLMVVYLVNYSLDVCQGEKDSFNSSQSL